MKGDFSRNTFNPTKRFSSVRMQQGRVQLDADWNEQVDIITHQLRTEAIDFIGVTGAPVKNAGFAITASQNNGNSDLLISAGRYYVNGFLCEKFNNEFYTAQEDYPNSILYTQTGTYLAYLETWQHSVSAVTDPAIREIALEGADTTVREKLVAQVKLYQLSTNTDPVNQNQINAAWEKITTLTTGQMLAEVNTPIADLQNQLYRIEIHQGGDEKTATFKWSRDNAAAAIRIINMQVDSGNASASITVDPAVSLEQLNFTDLQWVEVITEAQELSGESGILVQIKQITSNVIEVIGWPADQPGLSTIDTIAILRRWDMANGVINIKADTFIPIENGLQVKFSAGSYKTGDYWMITARAGTLIEWPVAAEDGKSISQLPHGIKRFYAQLAICKLINAQWQPPTDYRYLFNSLADIQHLTAIKIEPGAPAGSIDIKAQGKITLGATNPPAITINEDGSTVINNLTVNNLNSGSFSTASAPNKIPVADNTGIITPDWLTDRWLSPLGVQYLQMPRPRCLFQACVLNNKIYIFGGETISTDGNNTPSMVGYVDIYDFGDKEKGIQPGWTSIPDPEPRIGYGLCINADKKLIYLVCGSNRVVGDYGSVQNNVRVFDTNSNSFIKVKDAAGNYNNPVLTGRSPYRTWGSAAIGGDKRLYVFGGIFYDGTTVIRDVDVYGVTSDGTQFNYITTFNLPQVRMDFVAINVQGVIFLVGGRGSVSDNNPIPLISRYNGDIQYTDSFKWNVRRYPGVFTVGAKIFIAGGWDGQTVNNSIDVFDTANNIYDKITLTTMPAPRAMLGAVYANNQIYILGGTNNIDGGSKPLNAFSNVQIYKVSQV